MWLGAATLLAGLAGCTNRTASTSTSVAPPPTAVQNVKARATLDCKTGDHSEILKASVSLDGKKAIIYVRGDNSEKNVQVWDLANKKMLDSADNKNGVAAVAMSPLGLRAAYWSNAGQLQILQINGKGKGKGKGKVMNIPNGDSLAEWTNMYAPTGDERFLICGRKGVYVFDTLNYSLFQNYLVKGDKDTLLACSKPMDGAHVVVALASGPLQLVDYNVDEKGKTKGDGQFVFELKHDKQKPASALALSPDFGLTHAKDKKNEFVANGKLAAVEDNGQITVWDMQEKIVFMTIPIKDAKTTVPSLVFLPDGKTLVYPDEKNRIILHDVEKDTHRAVLEGHTHPVLALDVAPNGVLISGDKGGTLKVWDLPK